MLSDKGFLEFLDDKSLDGLNETDLKRIIDEESEKSEEEMDTELIEYCLDALNALEEKGKDKKKGEGDANGKRIKISIKKIIAAVVAAVVLLIGSLSVSAMIFDFDLSDRIVEFYQDRIKVRFDKADENAEEYHLLGSYLAKELKKNGISPVLLPDVFLTDNYNLSDVTYESFDVMLSAHFDFYNNESKFKGYMDISQYDDAAYFPSVDYLHIKDVTKISTNEIDVYVFNHGGSVSIGYQDGTTQYSIVVSTDFNTALSIAKTIK